MPPIDARAGERYALAGKVVTMNAGSEVLARGVVYIAGGRIAAVLDAGAPRPDGFAGCPLIRTGGTIYPGLIELHNHLTYNVLPLWQVPRRFTSREQWRADVQRRKFMSGPMELLADKPGYVAAIVRYVECKCLLAGVTTSQGVTLSSAPGVQTLFRGVVRNVERTDDDALPAARTRVADVESAEELRAQLARGRRLLLHLSEGVDDRARSHFLRLQLADGSWAVAPTLLGIHATGLLGGDWPILGGHGATVVWSPLSNLLLYGATLDLRAVRAAGVRLTLGSDWSPTGSKNLLGELKVAWLESERQGRVFTPRELVAMATVEAARALGWEAEVGSIEPGRRADLLVLRGAAGDPYRRLLRSDEAAVSLVLIDGVPRYGAARLMAPFGPGSEPWELGGEARVLDLRDPAAVIGSLTLAAAAERLRAGMAALPHPPPIPPDPTGGDGPQWSLVLEEEEGLGTALRPLAPLTTASVADIMAAASIPLEELVEPMALDELTVAEAPERFFARLATQPNLPPVLRDGLRALYPGA